MVQFMRLRVKIVASAEERVGLDAMSRAALLREGSDGAGGSSGSSPRSERFGQGGQGGGGQGGGSGQQGGQQGQASAEQPSLGEMRELSPDISGLETSLRRLKKLLELTGRYCEEVASGARQGDEAIGRAIADSLSAIPPFDADAFQRTFGRSVQDMLMVAYLATLTQAQIKLSERIALLPPAGSSSSSQQH